MSKYISCRAVLERGENCCLPGFSRSVLIPDWEAYHLCHLYRADACSYKRERVFIHNLDLWRLLFKNQTSLLKKIDGEGNGTPLQYSCLENPMDGGAWWAAVHGVAKSRTRLSDFPFTFPFHFSLSCIGEGNSNRSSVLAWRIPGTGEPGGLPSVGLHRVKHD